MTATPAVRHPYPVRIRLLTVLRTRYLSPGMRRIVLTGPELETTMPFEPLTVGTHVKVVVPDDHTGKVVLPTVGEHGLVWPDGHRRPVRDYTVSEFRVRGEQPPELSLDFVLHSHGPAGRWASRAAAGDRLGVMGPRGFVTYPATYDRYILGADETGLPATWRWIAEAPLGATLDVFVSVKHRDEERDMRGRAGLSMHWLDRSQGVDLATALTEAIGRSADGRTYVWAAAEAGTLEPVRRHLREIAFPEQSSDVRGYWRAAPDPVGRR